MFNFLCLQVSKLTLEITHQRLQLEGLAAQAEGERRKSKEKWERKIKKMEKANSEKMDSLVANLIQERSDSNIARLKTRLASREARIKQLEEEMEILRVDEEAVAVTKSLEEDLRNQVELLTHELEESKKHHTPVNTSLYLSLFVPLFIPPFLPPSLPPSPSSLSLLLLFLLSPFLSFSPPSSPSHSLSPSLPLSLSLFLPPFPFSYSISFILRPYSSISPSLYFLSISFLTSRFVGDASL